MVNNTGPYIEWWDSGHKRFEMFQDKGSYKDAYTKWHENGQISRQGRYQNGSPVGEWSTHNQDGSPRFKEIHEKRNLVEIVTWWKESLQQGGDEARAQISENCRTYAEYSSQCTGK